MDVRGRTAIAPNVSGSRSIRIPKPPPRIRRPESSRLEPPVSPLTPSPADDPEPPPSPAAAVTVAGGGVPRLEVLSVSKRYPGVVALADVSLRLMPGETLAVIGENGAGKSTLMKILAGIESADSGRLLLGGRDVSFTSPADAIASGISLIHQELNLHEELSVAENLYLGREPHRFGWVDRRALRRMAVDSLARVGLRIAPETPLGQLSTAARQLVEIAKAVATRASVVIMDEPTSSLSTHEAERLFALVGDLRAGGVSVIYISHRLNEIVRLADRVSVLRDGRNAGELDGGTIDHDRMVSAMVGRDISQLFRRQGRAPGEERLRVRGLVVAGSPAAASSGIDLAVAAGEVVGIAGLVGAGRSELLETIFGVRPARGGSVAVDGRPVAAGSVRSAIRAGLALVPEDRKRTGLLLASSVCENATLAMLPDAPAAPLVDGRWQQRVTSDMVTRLGVKSASPAAAVGTLSGGNQQKIAFGKWWLRQPRVLLLDEPTRGVDVGAKHEIYQLLDRLAGEGLAVLFVSSEMEEILALADRVIVMHEGRVSGELSRHAMTEEAMMRLAVGIERERS